MGQWLDFGWFWYWRTFDMELARRKLDNKTTTQTRQPPSPYGSHGTSPSAPPHTTISQHDEQHVYVIKTRGFCSFYYLLAM